MFFEKKFFFEFFFSNFFFFQFSSILIWALDFCADPYHDEPMQIYMEKFDVFFFWEVDIWCGFFFLGNSSVTNSNNELENSSIFCRLRNSEIPRFVFRLTNSNSIIPRFFQSYELGVSFLCAFFLDSEGNGSSKSNIFRSLRSRTTFFVQWSTSTNHILVLGWRMCKATKISDMSGVCAW